MSVRVAFVGFRHGHIMALYNLLRDRGDVTVVAACEEDDETRSSLFEQGVRVTHRSYDEMIATAECDVVACGDYFAIRGQRLVGALEAGKHVIGDKPLCTRMAELDRIEELAYAKHLKVGCMLDLPNLGPYIALRSMIRRGGVGEVHTITFLGLHPLNYAKRPQWYFEPGKHGGTLNDIGVHGVDIIPWLTGRTVTEITAARGWNARLPQHPDFQDAGTMMLKLDNNGCVLGDVSYLSADAIAYKLPAYWRFTVAGSAGVIETACNDTKVHLYRHDAKDPIEEPIASHQTGGFFDDFLQDVAGLPNLDGLHTARVLGSTRTTLLVQAVADSGNFAVPVPAG